MQTIQFHTVVDQEQVIRPPQGVRLPSGEIEVTVRPITATPPSQVEALAATRAWLLALASEAEEQAPDLPDDMAEHHDHYAHGKPLP